MNQITIRRFILAIFVLSASIFSPGRVDAEARLPAIFNSHMVLQRGQTVPVWGWAESGEQINVTFHGQSISTVADEQGKWIVRLKPMKANSRGTTLTIRATNTIELSDVVVGEVWLASGQSNMAMTTAKTESWKETQKTANDPLLRLFKVAPSAVSPLKPVSDCRGTWMTSNNKTAGNVTAAGYYFARRLRSELGVPVGLIDSSWGGTCAEFWTSREALLSTSETKPLWNEFKQRVESFDPATATPPDELQRLMADFRKRKAEADRNKTRRPKPPKTIGPPSAKRYTPCNMFNTMIHPLIPFGVRGVIWYQGESNRFRAEQYETLLPVMIDDWRKRWSQPELPFGIVQLANISRPTDEIRDSEWAELQWAQFQVVQSIPQTGLIIINDGEDVTLHPREKKKVGERLALWAQAITYGKTTVKYTGPVYRSSKVEADHIVLQFDHSDGLCSSNDQPLKRFQIAGSDQKWVWADAQIKGDAVIVSSSSIKKPVAVRYAWSGNPTGANLTNASELPASLFKTDNWPGITHGKLVPPQK